VADRRPDDRRQYPLAPIDQQAAERPIANAASPTTQSRRGFLPGAKVSEPCNFIPERAATELTENHRAAVGDVRRVAGVGRIPRPIRLCGQPSTTQGRARHSGIHCTKLQPVQAKIRYAPWSMRRGKAVRSSTGAAQRSQATGSCSTPARQTRWSSGYRSWLIVKDPCGYVPTRGAPSGSGNPVFRT